MRVRLIVGWLVLFSLVAAIGYAQQPPSTSQQPVAAASSGPVRTLSLAEALQIARENSPDFRAVQNNRWGAGMQNTSSVWSLFTPSAQLNTSRYHSSAGQRNIPGFPSASVPALTSYSWSLGFNYQLSGRTITNRGWSRASLAAVDQDIMSAQTLLETGVRGEYLTLLQARAQSDLARRSLERGTENLNLARARFSVGQGTLIDVRRAEVDKGQAEVTLLRAEQTVQNQVLRLFPRLGVPAPDGLNVVPTDSFPVNEPTWNQEQLVTQALNQNPALLSLRSQQESANWSVKAAKSEFLPSVNFNAGYGRYNQTQDTIRSNGTNPWNFTIGVSIPLFEGLSRNVAVQQARGQADDLHQAIRSRELTVRAEVVAALNGVQASYRTIDLQRANTAAANEALELGTQRYRVGSGTYLELLDARVAADRADADYVNAVYDYHKAIATLENAVGRPLR